MEKEAITPTWQWAEASVTVQRPDTQGPEQKSTYVSGPVFTTTKKGQDDINLLHFLSYLISKQDLKYFQPKWGAMGKTHTDLKFQSYSCYISHTITELPCCE